MERDIMSKGGLGRKEEKGRRKREVGKEAEGLSSELCNPQRPFLPIFLLTTPMQNQRSTLALPFSILFPNAFPILTPQNCTHANSTNPTIYTA